jgi:UDP-N-acetylmuramyl tripeptide synthase
VASPELPGTAAVPTLPTAPTEQDSPEPRFGFDDSRRLTGANRWFGGPAVTLTARGPAAGRASAHADWARRVREVCALLAWPDPAPRVAAGGHEVLLVFAAPESALMTATEINEWAWERASAPAHAAAGAAFDLAQDLGNEAADVAPHFAARAAADFDPALAALSAEARRRGLPLLADDDTVSIGSGRGSLSWPRAADTGLPAVDAVPWTRLHAVPTALVTGSNGKTTTVRLLAAMAAAAGHVPGWCCTEGVFVAGQAQRLGDYAGPAGARAVLRHPGVGLAVLETARGGLLRRGLALEHAEVAVVTNVRADHLGEYGISSADDLAEVKLAVAHALRRAAGTGLGADPGGPPRPGTLVLNAADTTLMAAAARAPQVPGARLALFALSHHHPALAALRATPGRAAATCGVEADRLWLWRDGRQHDLGPIASMPLALGGAAAHNVENMAAAALAADALGLAPAIIAVTLQAFGRSPLDNPGRLERWDHRGATVLIDYAHNPDGLAQLLSVARALQPRRLWLLLGQAGNRDDAALADLARTAASFAPDFVRLKELPQMLRGRALGEVPAKLRQALLAAGVAPDRIALQADEEAAARALIDAAQAGDVVVLPVHTAAVRERLVEWLSAQS